MSAGRARPLLKGILTLFFLLVIVAAVLRAFFFLPVQAEGNEMAPAVFRGDWVLATLRATPVRGDIIVFEHPQKKGVMHLRRVVGLPGETVSIEGQVVSVGDQAFTRSKIDRLVVQEPGVPDGRPLLRELEQAPGGRSWGVLLDPRRRTKDIGIAAKDGYVVLGDSRNHAVDSREYGPIAPARVKGVVRYYLSAKPVKGIPPRGTRIQ